MRSRRIIKVEIVGDGDVTIAEVKDWTHGLSEGLSWFTPRNAIKRISAYGSARRDPEDKRDITIGELLATGRALEKAGRKLQRRANGLVRQAENERIHKELAKNRPVPYQPVKE